VDTVIAEKHSVLILHCWRSGQKAPPKRCYLYFTLRSPISLKTVVFISTVMITKTLGKKYTK